MHGGHRKFGGKNHNIVVYGQTSIGKILKEVDKEVLDRVFGLYAKVTHPNKRLGTLRVQFRSICGKNHSSKMVFGAFIQNL
jgi:hypothetical protein